MRRLQEHGVAAGPSLSASELLADPHLQARGLFVETEAPLGGRKPTIGPPWRIKPGPLPQYTPAPRLGQDNDYVFKTLLGLSGAEVAELIASGVAF